MENGHLQGLRCLNGMATIGEDITNDIAVPGVNDCTQVGITVTHLDIGEIGFPARDTGIHH